jgi:hypothetical protein
LPLLEPLAKGKLAHILATASILQKLLVLSLNSLEAAFPSVATASLFRKMVVAVYPIVEGFTLSYQVMDNEEITPKASFPDIL